MSDEVFPCFNKHLRDFLVSVTVHKARNLIVLNADTFVTVNFNGDSKKTKTYQNSDCPFYNEVWIFVSFWSCVFNSFQLQYFVFELRMTLEELLKKNLRLSVIHDSSFLKRNSIIGEVNVNLSTVWKQNRKYNY